MWRRYDCEGLGGTPTRREVVLCTHERPLWLYAFAHPEAQPPAAWNLLFSDVDPLPTEYDLGILNLPKDRRRRKRETLDWILPVLTLAPSSASAQDLPFFAAATSPSRTMECGRAFAACGCNTFRRDLEKGRRRRAFARTYNSFSLSSRSRSVSTRSSSGINRVPGGQLGSGSEASLPQDGDPPIASSVPVDRTARRQKIRGYRPLPVPRPVAEALAPGRASSSRSSRAPAVCVSANDKQTTQSPQQRHRDARQVESHTFRTLRSRGVPELLASARASNLRLAAPRRRKFSYTAQEVELNQAGSEAPGSGRPQHRVPRAQTPGERGTSCPCSGSGLPGTLSASTVAPWGHAKSAKHAQVRRTRWGARMRAAEDAPPHLLSSPASSTSAWQRAPAALRDSPAHGSWAGCLWMPGSEVFFPAKLAGTNRKGPSARPRELRSSRFLHHNTTTEQHKRIRQDLRGEYLSYAAGLDTLPWGVTPRPSGRSWGSRECHDAPHVLFLPVNPTRALLLCVDAKLIVRGAATPVAFCLESPFRSTPETKRDVCACDIANVTEPGKNVPSSGAFDTPLFHSVISTVRRICIMRAAAERTMGRVATLRFSGSEFCFERPKIRARMRRCAGDAAVS
eukprot:scaffold69_cov248-Pinguiococcus_pyrenoidosus.AAC.75